MNFVKIFFCSILLLVIGSTSLDAQVKSAPVVFERDTLFYIDQNLGSFSSEDRAAQITRLIAGLKKLPRAEYDSLKVVVVDGHADIIHDNKVLASINPWDTKSKNKGVEEQATAYKEKIRLALIENFENPTLSERTKDLVFFILALLGLFIVFNLVNRGFDFLRKNLKTLERNVFFRRNKFIRFFELISPETERGLLLFILRMTRFTAIGLFLYLYLPFMFSQISYTRGFGEQLLETVLKPIKYVIDGFLGFLPNLLFIVVILVAINYLIRAMSHAAHQVKTEKIKLGGFYPDWAIPTFNLMRVLVIIFTIILIFPYLPGSGSDAFKGVSVFVGLLLSLGSAGAISNVISGVILTYMRPFKIGDRVQINNITGDVISRNLLVTRIKTTKNEEITMPNASLLGGGVVNYSSMAEEKGLILHTAITIGYDIPWQIVHELMINAALDTQYIEQIPKPFVQQKSLNDFNITYEVNAYTKDSHKMPNIYSELHCKIQDKFNEAGVEIMSPHYSSIRDGNATTTPVDYRNVDYVAPAFGIKSITDKII